MKRTLLAGMLALLMCFGVLSFAGCGGDPEQLETVRIIAHSEMEDVLEPFFQKFMAENEDIRIEVLYGVDQLDQMDTQYPPDLLFIGNVQLDSIAHYFVDLNPLMEDYFGGEAEAQAFMDTFLTGTAESLVRDGKQLVLPVNANVSLLYYNEDLFDAEELAYPTNDWTLSDFVENGKKLTKQEDGRYTQWGASTTQGWWGEYLIYARLFGGDFYDASGNLALNTPAFKQGIQFFKDKAEGPDKFSPNPGSTAVGQGDLGGFASRRTAMELGGHTGNWPSYNALDNFNWNVAMIPTADSNPDGIGAELAVEGYGIYTGALNKEKAFRVLMYMFSEEGQYAFGSLGRLVPTTTYRDHVLATPYEERSNPKNMEAVFAQMEKSAVLPTDPNFQAVAGAPVYNTIATFLNGGYADVDAWAEAATKAAEDYLATVS